MIKVFLLFLLSASAAMAQHQSPPSSPARECVEDRRGGIPTCMGDIVLDRADQMATVTRIFRDGKVDLKYVETPGLSYHTSIRGLGQAIQTDGRLKVGSIGLDSLNKKVAVKYVFDNGKVVTKYWNIQGMDVQQASSIGLAVDCYRQVCVGATGHDEITDKPFALKQAYDDGRLLIKFWGIDEMFVRNMRDVRF